MSATHVRMEHPETGGVWDAPLDYAPIARARGWVDSDKPLAEELVDNTKDAGLPDQELVAGFNPADHTVAEVKEYLDEVGDNTQERDRVVELERVSQNRKSIVGTSDTEKE